MVARLSCLDLLSRVATEPHSSDQELQKVAGVVVKYLLDSAFFKLVVTIDRFKRPVFLLF